MIIPNGQLIKLNCDSYIFNFKKRYMRRLIKDLLKFFIMSGVILTSSGLSAQQIPLDPSVRTGKLPNGLTYYIRHNEEPQKRAYMMIVNHVGSILEDDDQQGLAHFMEHMNFNGTTHFPKNELVDVLEKSGIKFGADLNAYTNFDETVYILPIPTNDPKMLPKGLDVLRDWAREATLDPVEIDKERGVILEEERLHKGLGERIQKQVFPVLTNHSKYSNRMPIGKTAILKTFKPEAIVRFKNDWYRPDLQAVIVVGDVDVDQTENMIKSKFSDLKNPSPERKRATYSIPLKGKNQFLIVTDEEQPSVVLQVLFKRESNKIQTEEDYTKAIKGMLLNQMLSFRQYEMTSTDPAPDYLNMGMGRQNYLSNIEMFTFSVTAKEGKLKEAFFKTWGLLDRIRKNGFSKQDLEQAKTALLKDYEQSLKEKDHTPSKSIAREYASLFLKGEASPGITWEYDFVKSKLPEITVADINGLLRGYLTPRDRDIILVAPSNQKDSLPDETQIESWITKIASEKMEAFSDDLSDGPLVETLPAPGKVISKQDYPELNITELKLSNGIKIVLKPTTFKSDEISFSAFSEGGISLYDKKDYYNATYATGVLSSMGLGTFSPAQLQRKLTGKTANVSVGLGNRVEVVNGSSSVKDLETALQLVYLKFTAPRKDTLLFSNIINRSEEGIKKRYLTPKNVFGDTIRYVMGNYNYRYAPPTLNMISSLNLDEMYRIYKERFADASGFTFIFVGNFDVDQITPLLEKYLGALPSTFDKEQARDLKIETPEGHLVKKVKEEKENKATVQMVIHNEYKYGAVENMKLRALVDILQMRLLKVLRESEGEVYSPSARVSYDKYPRSEYAIRVSFVCSPNNVDHLIDLTKKEMEKIKATGVTNDEIEKFKAAYKKDIEQAMQNNAFWLSYLTTQYENRENLDAVNLFEKNMDEVTGKSLLKASKKILNGKNIIAFELLPKENNKQ